ncbi:MAG: hypothetical protein V1844_13090 [Pseudomonadota bacterium]
MTEMVPRGIPIRIAVIYEPGKRIRPVWFELNRRQYRVVETTYHWRDKIGETDYLHYTVTDGDVLYELIFNPHDQTWTLNAQQTE